MFMILAKWVLS